MRIEVEVSVKLKLLVGPSSCTRKGVIAGAHAVTRYKPLTFHEGYHAAIGRVAAVGRVDEGICVQRIDNGGSVGFCHLCRRPIRKRISVGRMGTDAHAITSN
jgi:hypothetical protein